MSEEFKELKTELKQLNVNVADIKTNFAVFLKESSIFFSQNEKDHTELKEMACTNRAGIGDLKSWKQKAQGALYVIGLLLVPLLIEYLRIKLFH